MKGQRMTDEFTPGPRSPRQSQNRESAEAMSRGSSQPGPTHWFGPSWGAPACRPETHRPTPSDPCACCFKAFGPADSGLIIASGHEQFALHYECRLTIAMADMLGVSLDDARERIQTARKP